MAYAKELVLGGFSAGQAAGAGGQTNTVTALGSTIADAAQLHASMNIVSAADGTVGVQLRGGMPGDEVWVFNNAASTLKVYPNLSTSAICVPGTGLGTAGTAFAHLTYKTAVYKCVSSTQWFVNVTA
jgi:hypothetical protein